MEFKGTQGEWEFVEYHSGELIGVRVISDSENENIFDTGLGGWVSNETVANYKLSSFSPKMLEMINELIHMFSDPNNTCGETELLNEAKELIKKATE